MGVGEISMLCAFVLGQLVGAGGAHGMAEGGEPAEVFKTFLFP